VLDRLRQPQQTFPEGDGQDILLTGWGRTVPTRSRLIRPETAQAVEAALHGAPERGTIARGLGRSYGDPAQNAGGVVVDMTAIKQVHDFNVQHGIITVDAGLSLAELASMVLPFGYFLPVSPGTQHVTIGGAIACDIHGKNHHLDGSFGEHVVSMDLLTPEGQCLQLTPETDSDVFWATVGGMGLTGVILRVTIELMRVTTSRMVVDTDRTANLDEVMRLQAEEDDRYRYSVAWVDCLATGRNLGRSILMRGDHATVDQIPDGLRQQPLNRKTRPSLPSPPWAPSGLLRPASVRLLNEVWFRKAPRQERQVIQSIDAFFFPLDVLSGWNRLYGDRGFLQYQLVVPDGRANVIQAVIERLASGRWPTALAVLKRTSGAQGDMSFALPGWTLAVDIPAGVDGLGELLDGLDALVAASGGRVYLAKDSRMRPEMIPVMYPKHREWQATLARIDPNRRMRSDLARRLMLQEAE
jgi:decaprenylphospho-beta-D-ribofuranose 2-oxidase